MSLTFTPPARSQGVPPILPQDGPGQSPLARRLFRHYRGRPEGINVFLYSDGTISETEPDSSSTWWEQSQGPPGCVYVVTAWYGGHDDYELTEYEAALLEANGYTVEGSVPPTPTPPVITSLSPSSGVSGTTVTVIGTNMSEVTAASFDGSSVAVTLISGTRVSIVVPVDVDGTYGVTVTNPSGESNSVSFTIETPVVGAAPVVSAVTPPSGAAGTALVITGTSFTGATSVLVGGNAASFSVNSSSLINATAPAHADGAVSVVVTTGFGVSNEGTFTYSTVVSDPHPGADILLEDGSYLLLEDGTSSLLQES